MPSLEETLRGRAWIEELVFRMLKSGEDAAYACFLQNVNYCTIQSPTAPLAAVGVSKGGDISLFINETWVRHFDLKARIHLLKHEIGHIVNGHIASRGLELMEQYVETYGEKMGKQITNYAADMVVEQSLNQADMKSAEQFMADKWSEIVEKLTGKKEVYDPRLFASITPEVYGFPRDKTTEEYCRLLEDKLNKDGSLTPDSLKGLKGPSFGTLVTGEELYGNENDDKENSASKSGRDAATDRVIKAVKDEVGEEAYSKERGFQTADAVELIEQLKKQPEVPWHAVLRGMESRLRTCLRRATFTKPSRRNPDHMGFKRRRKLYVWFGADTSGSMGKKELSMVDAELRGIAARGAIIDVIHQDAAICDRSRYSRVSGIKEFCGRGGTDFSPLFQELLHIPKRDKPAMLIFYTDGQGGLERYYDELKQHGISELTGSATADGVEVLWLLTHDGMSIEDFKKIATFGRIMKVKLGEDLQVDDEAGRKKRKKAV